MAASYHSSQSIDASFNMLVSDLNKSFPNADICERLALNRLRHALARQQELAEMTGEIHPAASADVEVRRAYSAADRDFWRALRYLQRRLDHRARLAERKANPTPAYANTLFPSDPQLADKTPAPTSAVASAEPIKLRPTNPNKPVIDIPLTSPNTTFIPMTIVPANKPLAPTTFADCVAFEGHATERTQYVR